MSRVIELAGMRILECSTHGPPPRTAKDATDIVGEAGAQRTRVVALAADWLGDVARRTAESKALRDWVGECNRRPGSA